MTAKEALDARIRFIRLPHWEPSAHIELPLLPAGQYGPWATVRDVSGETSLFMLTLLEDDDSRYEPFVATRERRRET